MAKHLRKKGLIEGRRPNLSISQSVSNISFNEKKDDTRANQKDKSYYVNLILRYLEENGPSNRVALNEYLLPQLGKSLSKKEKMKRISNIISNLRRSGYIVNQGSRTRSKWVLVSKTIKN